MQAHATSAALPVTATSSSYELGNTEWALLQATAGAHAALAWGAALGGVDEQPATLAVAAGALLDPRGSAGERRPRANEMIAECCSFDLRCDSLVRVALPCRRPGWGNRGTTDDQHDFGAERAGYHRQRSPA